MAAVSDFRESFVRLSGQDETEQNKALVRPAWTLCSTVRLECACSFWASRRAVESTSFFAHYQCLLRDLNQDVLQRPSSAAFPCEIWRVEATIAIETLEVIEGELPTRALTLVHEWAIIHKEELRKDWQLCQTNAVPIRIEPLA